LIVWKEVKGDRMKEKGKKNRGHPWAEQSKAGYKILVGLILV
jgi:hypothetical protein